MPGGRAEKEAAARRATDRQILKDADHLITVWNQRQAKRVPMLFSPTIGAGHEGRLLVPTGKCYDWIIVRTRSATGIGGHTRANGGVDGWNRVNRVSMPLQNSPNVPK